MSTRTKNILKTMFAFVSGGVVIWGLTVIFNTGGFVSTSKASNTELKDHKDKDDIRVLKQELKDEKQDDYATKTRESQYDFKTEALVKIQKIIDDGEALKETFERGVVVEEGNGKRKIIYQEKK